MDKGTRTVVFQSASRAFQLATRAKASSTLHLAEALISSIHGDSFLRILNYTLLWLASLVFLTKEGPVP